MCVLVFVTGGHPDPNLTYAHDLVEKMGLDKEHKVDDAKVPDFGAAGDEGDLAHAAAMDDVARR